MSFTCFLNLRIKGTIIYSKCIFDTKSCDNIYSQLSKLGLIIHNTPLWSFWICHKCCSVITRLQRDTEIFQKWKNEETTETTKTCQGEDTSSTDKRDRDPTPSKTPRLIKKSRKSTEMPLRSSVTEVGKKCCLSVTFCHAVMSFVVLPQISIHVIGINSSC